MLALCSGGSSLIQFASHEKALPPLRSVLKDDRTPPRAFSFVVCRPAANAVLAGFSFWPLLALLKTPPPSTVEAATGKRSALPSVLKVDTEGRA